MALILFSFLVTFSIADVNASEDHSSLENIAKDINEFQDSENNILQTTTIPEHEIETPEDNNNESTLINNDQYHTSYECTDCNDDCSDYYLAAAGDTYDNVQAIYIQTADVAKLDANELISMGITDVFVLCKRFSSPYYSDVLPQVIAKLEGTNIRVHAWVVCFKDAAGNWVDPQSTEGTPTINQVLVSYYETVRVPVRKSYQTTEKVWYKSWYRTGRYKQWYRTRYRQRYKSRGHWLYRWAYRWRYRWAYRWRYTWKYYNRTVTKYYTAYENQQQLKYKYVTQTTPSELTYQQEIIDYISKLVTDYDINGVQLDYVRYSGVGDNAAYKHNGDEVITNFVKDVYDSVKAINAKVAVSAALMPECGANAYYYGQDYEKLAPYLDFMVPMIYKGNYNKDTAWIGTTTQYIVNKANGTPVVVGLQTYVSDSNIQPIPASELEGDIEAAISNGSSGYALFRYGLISNNNSSTEIASVTVQQVLTASTNLKNFVISNKKLPNTIMVGIYTINTAQFLHIMLNTVVQLDQGKFNPIPVKTVGIAPNPSGQNIYGNIMLSEYVNNAKNILKFIETNGRAPNYSITSLGNLNYEYLVFSYAKILDFYKVNNRLPNYAIIQTSDMNLSNQQSSIPAELQAYLIPTANCQSNNAAIINLAKQITNGLTSEYDKAKALFEWVRDKCSYTFYYNTKYGAVNMVTRRNGNCIDQAHLLNALARSLGIPARYAHAQCEFTTMTVGHIWSELYVNGQWITADPSSTRNTFGTMVSGKILYWKGRYAELPF